MAKRKPLENSRGLICESEVISPDESGLDFRAFHLALIVDQIDET
jgi:hypothetical protein